MHGGIDFGRGSQNSGYRGAEAGALCGGEAGYRELREYLEVENLKNPLKRQLHVVRLA